MDNQISKENCNKIISELDRVKDAVEAYIKELDENNGRYYICQ